MLQDVLLVCTALTLLFCGSGLAQSDQQERQKLQVVGHAHMDPVYRWRWNEIRNREIHKTFSDVLAQLDAYPDLHFAQSYLLYYETIQTHFPELFEQVKQSIEDKRWSVVGAQWVEPDETLISGESLIRQFLIAKDYYTKHLDIESIDIAWSPDVFTGHPGTLPKIYAGCGIKSYVFSREPPQDKRIFWWESKDGSRILGYKTPGHYNPDFKKLPDQLKAWRALAEYDMPMITIGKGDHGGGPSERDIRALDSLKDRFQFDIEHVSPEDYFHTLHQADTDWPVQQGEFGYPPQVKGRPGCYTSQAKIKKYNRYLENRLIAAEKFSAIGTMHKGKPFYPREDFLAAWKLLLFNQFHDIIPGTLTGLGVNDAYDDYEQLDRITSELLNAGLENIGSRIDTEMDGIPLVVYNPHSWPVSQYVEAEIRFVKKPTHFTIAECNGNRVPYSIRSTHGLNYRVSMRAKNTPPLGYHVYEVREEKPADIATDLIVGENQIENSYYILQWDEQGITSLVSKKHRREMLKARANQLQLLEDNGNSWGLDLTGKEFQLDSLAGPRLVFQSPLQVVVQWEDHYQSSTFVRTMTVKADCDQIDFAMDVDWHSHNKLLRLRFPTAIKNGQAYYDQAYGYVKREESSAEYPGQKWIDVSNEKLGLSLINNGKYGFTIDGGVLTLSVVRGPRDMDPRMDEGKHSFNYALCVHAGDWRHADVPLKAWQFNQPLLAKQENQHPGPISGWGTADLSLPREKAFYRIDSDHVIISSLKTKQDAYNLDVMILRIVETEGRDDEVTVHLPYQASRVTECNHLEEPIESRSQIVPGENRFSFKIGHDQIRTFEIRF